MVRAKMNLKNNGATAIIGDPDSGKTNLMIYLGRESGYKDKYILGYPKEIHDIKGINSLDDLQRITDCVLLIDEVDMYFPVWEKRSNQKLIEFLKFTHHNNIKVIMTAQLSQAFTKQVEAFIGQWAVKKIMMRTLKNGSIPKNILKHDIKHPNITSDFVKLQPAEFVWWNRDANVGENGVRSFPYQHIKKDWRNTDQNTDKKATRRTTKK
jgi:hypothetical protein